MEDTKVNVTTCKVNLDAKLVVNAILAVKPITGIYDRMFSDIQNLMDIEDMPCKCPNCLLEKIHTPEASKKLPEIYTKVIEAYQESFAVMTKSFTGNDAVKMLLPLIIVPQLAPKMVEDIPGGLDMLIDVYIQNEGSDNAEENLEGLSSWNRINQIFLDVTFMVCKGFDMGNGRMQMPPEVAEAMAAAREGVPAGTTLQ